jgi:endonuclease/exonuclease/phosphatase family metal-dependent hydrolase
VIAPPPIAPAPAPVTPSGTLRLLHWNAHHGGIGTDGKYDPARIAALVAAVDPDIVDFNEVDDADQVAAILNALNKASKKSGGGWKSYAAWKTVIMTRMAVTASSPCTFDANQGWRGAHVSVMANGRSINLWTTHLDVDSGGNRMVEAAIMQGCALAWPEARILAGDYNMQEDSAEYNVMSAFYTDAWPAARALGATTNYSGNCDGCTRNSRIDYVFVSKGQSFVTVQSAEIIDSRDSNGAMPSDHKPMLVTFKVK